MYPNRRVATGSRLRSRSAANGPRNLARPVVFAMLVLLVAAFGAAWYVASRLDLDPAVAITAHRGASAVGA